MTDQTKAPERIWLDGAVSNNRWVTSPDQSMAPYGPYTYDDISDAKIAEAEQRGYASAMDAERKDADARIETSVIGLIWDKHPDDCEWYAVTTDSDYGPEMGYTLTKNTKERFIVRMRSGGEKLGKFDTFEAAQAAAQAHHVAHILGCISQCPTKPKR